MWVRCFLSSFPMCNDNNIIFLIFAGWIPSFHRSLAPLRQVLLVHVVQSASRQTQILQEAREAHVAGGREAVQGGAPGEYTPLQILYTSDTWCLVVISPCAPGKYWENNMRASYKRGYLNKWCLGRRILRYRIQYIYLYLLFIYVPHLHRTRILPYPTIWPDFLIKIT